MLSYLDFLYRAERDMPMQKQTAMEWLRQELPDVFAGGQIDPLEFCNHTDLVRFDAGLGRMVCPICTPVETKGDN